jgi:hypothetical protein
MRALAAARSKRAGSNSPSRTYRAVHGWSSDLVVRSGRPRGRRANPPRPRGQSTANRYAGWVASKKRRSAKSKGPQRGISGNPQRRAEQLAERRPDVTGETDLSPWGLDFGPEEPEENPLLEVAYALAGGAKPSPWWAESHDRILAAARAVTWPTRLVDVETQACRVVGDEFYERFDQPSGGLNPPQWLRALAEETGAVLRASVADGTADWPQLWALLIGLALTTPPGDTTSERAELAREYFPDIKDPLTTVRAEVDKAAKLMAERGLAADLAYPADGCRPAGEPLVARDVYGSRFLLVAPFSYDGEVPDHWYAWDVDSCWIVDVVGAGVFGSAADALAEWQRAVGPAAGTELSPSTQETTAGLLAPCLKTGPLSDMLQGYEPRELIREYYRLRRRAHDLAGATAASAAAASSGDDELRPMREAFLSWHAARHRDVPQDTADSVDIILYQWVPSGHAEERWRYACSPHRIEMTARLIRDGYALSDANAALRLLPEWTQWCIGQSGISGDFAARSRAAALTEAAALVDAETRRPAGERDEAPFRRRE